MIIFDFWLQVLNWKPLESLLTMLTLSQVCVNEKSMNMAEQIVDKARLMGSKSAINAFVYAKLIQGYCSSNQRKEAFALLAVCLNFVFLSSNCISSMIYDFVRLSFFRLYIKISSVAGIIFFKCSISFIYRYQCISSQG